VGGVGDPARGHIYESGLDRSEDEKVTDVSATIRVWERRRVGHIWRVGRPIPSYSGDNFPSWAGHCHRERGRDRIADEKVMDILVTDGISERDLPLSEAVKLIVTFN
jgi:hypothetical protein